jgi:hypothetical protein
MYRDSIQFVGEPALRTGATHALYPLTQRLGNGLGLGFSG